MNKKIDKKSVTFQFAIFVAILIFLNLVSLNVFKRLDLTQGKIYSLSDASKNSVRELEDRLVIKAYFTKNLPGEYADTRRFTIDLLSEYQAYSRGKLHFEFIDPKDEDKLKEEAQKNRIQPVSMRVIENDKMEIREVYLGLAFLYNDKTETIPLVQNTRGLEYAITSTIKKIAVQNMPKVAFFTQESNPEQMFDPRTGQMPDDYQTARQFISNNYEMQKVELEEAVDSSISALIIAGITDSLTSSQLYNLDQYIMNGGKVLLFQDKVQANLQMQAAQDMNTNIFDLFNHYGISMHANLVADANCGQIQVQEQRGIFRMAVPVAYPYFPVVHEIENDHAIVSNLDNIQFVFASEIDTTRIKQGVHFTPLLNSSKNSGETRGPQYNISFAPYKGKDLKPMFSSPSKILAGLYEGIFTSYFAGKEESNNEGFINEIQAGGIILVTDSDFIKENAGISVPGNLDFLQNSVDYLAGDSSLIELRSRETEYRPLKELKPGLRNLVKWLNVLLPSLLLIIFGLINYHKEITRRKMVKVMYE